MVLEWVFFIFEHSYVYGTRFDYGIGHFVLYFHFKMVLEWVFFIFEHSYVYGTRIGYGIGHFVLYLTLKWLWSEFFSFLNTVMCMVLVLAMVLDILLFISL